MREWITAAVLLIGAGFTFLAAVGVVRMPDLFTRMQASTKGGTFGIGLMLSAVAIHFGELGVTTRALLVVAFFVLTNPVAAHMISRAAYLGGAPLWKGTVVDDLEGRYDLEGGRLESLPVSGRLETPPETTKVSAGEERPGTEAD